MVHSVYEWTLIGIFIVDWVGCLGFGGGAYLREQVPGEVLQQGLVPPARPQAPLPRSPHQQDVVLRRRRQVSTTHTSPNHG